MTLEEKNEISFENNVWDRLILTPVSRWAEPPGRFSVATCGKTTPYNTKKGREVTGKKEGAVVGLEDGANIYLFSRHLESLLSL